jgi:RNA polymerase primary sigma factor
MKNNTHHWIDQSEINRYLQDVRKYPTLTREEENKLIIKIKNGCEKSKDTLIHSNLRFVIKMAKQYQNQGLSMSDLISEGNYGLLKAAQRYDYNQTEVRFLSYAIWWVKQSMLQSLHENSRSIRLPVNVINEMNKLRKTAPTEFKPIPDSPESILGLPTIKYLDAPNNNEEEIYNYDIIEDVNAERPDLIFADDRTMLELRLKKVLSNLSESERYVAIKYFGLDGQNSLTLQDISEDMDLTKERVRQIKEKAIKKLRFYSRDLFELL